MAAITTSSVSRRAVNRSSSFGVARSIAGLSRHWRLWLLLGCSVVLTAAVAASRAAASPIIACAAAGLVPVATLALVNWGARWQAALSATCLVAAAATLLMTPMSESLRAAWLGTIAAGLTLVQLIALKFDRWRARAERRITKLLDAAAAHEAQLASMMHDIRSPLAALSGLVTLLMEAQSDDAQQRHLLARIWTTAASLDLLIKNLLDLYLADENRVKSNSRPVDPDAILVEAAERCAIEARLKGLDVHIEPGGVGPVRLDPLHLERIITNLLASAVRRTAAGAIRVRSFQRDGHLMIEVSDTGPRVTAEEIAEIFSRPDSATKAPPSIALSRYIASRLVTADGGRILASSGDGWGLQLTVQLPAGAILAA